MTDDKSVLVVGLDPALIDFSGPGYHAPQARLCFNQLPSDIAAAVKRWV